MMGELQSGQDSLFYNFSLKSHVPNNHMLRALDKFADLGFVRQHLKDHYSHAGRPSIDYGFMRYERKRVEMSFAHLKAILKLH